MGETKYDLCIIAAEVSADLHGAKLVEQLLSMRPHLKIAAVAGPRMRKLPIKTFLAMEQLQVMGFLDVLIALPKIIRIFFTVQRMILTLNPKALICIDYPGFNLRLERSLKKKGFRGKLIHYICPSVWAWGKRRIPLMAETLDLLLTLFPFEPASFSSTLLHVEYVGHPLISQIPDSVHRKPKNSKTKKRILALFPGSRRTEIQRNFPMQLSAAKKLLTIDPNLKIASSIAHPDQENLLRSLAADLPITFFPFKKNYELMHLAHAAIATSGTVSLELALHAVPSVINFAIRSIDLFLATKIFRIHLPFYCIVNLIASEGIFPELFGPQLTEEKLFSWIQILWEDQETRLKIKEGCHRVRQLLGQQDASERAAKLVVQILYHL